MLTSKLNIIHSIYLRIHVCSKNINFEGVKEEAKVLWMKLYIRRRKREADLCSIHTSTNTATAACNECV